MQSCRGGRETAGGAGYASINVRLAALRRPAYDGADTRLLSPKLALAIQQAKGAKKLGHRLGNSLTVDPVSCQALDCTGTTVHYRHGASCCAARWTSWPFRSSGWAAGDHGVRLEKI